MVEELLRSFGVTRDWMVALGIIGFYLVVTALVYLLWTRLLKPVAQFFHAELFTAVLLPTRRVVLAGLMLTGLDEALSALRVVERNRQLALLLDRADDFLWAFIILWTFLKLLGGSLDLYVRRMAERPSEPRDISYQVSQLRKAITVVAAILFVAYVLNLFGVNTSPLLASGAIGGVAIAFALQDTLSNLLAGFFLSIDRPLKVGDFVKIGTGEEGYVEEVGWRNTRIRMLANNAVVVPNAKLSQSTLLNYHLPTSEMSVYVPGRVVYGTDLALAERVILEAAERIQREVEGAVPDWQPNVRWRSFEDASIRFQATLRVRGYEDQFLVQSEFMKALEHRFREAGIEMAAPTPGAPSKPAPSSGLPSEQGAPVRGEAQEGQSER